MYDDRRDLTMSMRGDPPFTWEMNNNMVTRYEIAGWQVLMGGAFIADSDCRNNDTRYRKIGVDSAGRCEPLNDLCA